MRAAAPLFSAVCLALMRCAGALAQETVAANQSELEHVPPAPPGQVLHHLSYPEMVRMMQMDDRRAFGKVILDRLDWRSGDGTHGLAWNAQAWYGGDYNKLRLETEGERRSGGTAAGRIEVLWDRVAGRWWNLQAGIRHDFGPGPAREWAAIGTRGLAPGFFDLQAALYLGEAGRVAARFTAARDLLLTQRLILQPELELQGYSKDDPANAIGSGLSRLELGLRLRYEWRRELAPYLGLVWDRGFGRTAEFARAGGERSDDLQLLAGIRLWF